MKRLIALLAGAMFVIALTFVNTGSGFAADKKDTDEKVYKDEDLSKSKMDEDKSTVNQMENEKQGTEGSAAGGMRKEDQGKKYEGGGEKEPVELPPPSY